MLRTVFCTLLFFLQAARGQGSVGDATTGNYRDPQPDNNGTDSVTLQTQILFDGGVPICDEGCNGSFACSRNTSFLMDPGNWRHGNWSFVDPAVNLTTTSSEYYLLTQISLTITGVFNCKANKGNNATVFSLSLQNYEIDNWEIEELQDNCTCFNCQQQINGSTAVYYGGWPNYNYNNTNYVSVAVTENVLCLDMIVFDFMFAKQVRPIDVVYVNRTNNSNAAKEVYFGVSIGVACTVVLVMIVFSIVLLALRRRKRNRRNQYETINEPAIDRSVVGGIKFTIKEKEVKLGPRIGKGSYGEVYRAEWRGITVAVKRLPIVLLANEDVLKDFQREATIMSSLRHPNVLQFLGSCQINNDVAILTEYMDHGSLYRLLHDQSFDMTWTLIKRFALETAQGMVYLHCSTPPILHRDLKSHNLLVDSSYRLKISDFGLSKVLGVVNQTMTSCGTAAWAAPEVLRNSRYTEKADVFSYGVCLWEFFTRQDPYEGMPTFQIIFAVGTEGLRPTIPSNCPVAYRNLIEECWDTNPNRRPNFLSIVERLKRLD